MAWATPMSTAVDRNESCAPTLAISAGRQMSRMSAANARALSPGERRPIPAAAAASQTTSVARTTGVSARTRSI
jgi:hypothetical protein